MFKVVVTCEHGGNKIPDEYALLFNKADALLESHRAWDIGALRLASAFAQQCADYFYFSQVSRLLVDLNRSLYHPRLLSDISKKLSPEEKNVLLAHYYFPYREEVTHTIKEIMSQGLSVIHLSVHSFTPNLKQRERSTEIGFLYDSHRNYDKKFSILWKEKILENGLTLRIRLNYPYLGISDGFVPFLRKLFPQESYIGLELEVNQRILLDEPQYLKLEKTLITSFNETLASFIAESY